MYKRQREDNQLLREELREVNQENMNKLDERIELAKEELNKKITETKKSLVKKLEQEVVVVNQQIREVDERCRQTENEVLEVREVIHKEITPVSYTHLDVYKRQTYNYLKERFWKEKKKNLEIN